MAIVDSSSKPITQHCSPQGSLLGWCWEFITCSSSQAGLPLGGCRGARLGPHSVSQAAGPSSTASWRRAPPRWHCSRSCQAPSCCCCCCSLASPPCACRRSSIDYIAVPRRGGCCSCCRLCPSCLLCCCTSLFFFLDLPQRLDSWSCCNRSTTSPRGSLGGFWLCREERHDHRPRRSWPFVFRQRCTRARGCHMVVLLPW